MGLWLDMCKKSQEAPNKSPSYHVLIIADLDLIWGTGQPLSIVWTASHRVAGWHMAHGGDDAWVSLVAAPDWLGNAFELSPKLDLTPANAHFAHESMDYAVAEI